MLGQYDSCNGFNSSLKTKLVLLPTSLFKYANRFSGYMYNYTELGL